MDSHFTFTWAINNIYKKSVFSLNSPEFAADTLDKTRWRLCLFVARWNPSLQGHLVCVLQRERDESGLDSICIGFQMSIVDGEGLILRSVREEICRFGKNSAYVGDNSNRVSKNLIQIKTLLENVDKYLCNNTLILRCRMWKFGCIVSRSDLCFARTILDVEKRYFVWNIENIFSILPGQNRTIYVPAYNKGSSSIQLNLCLKQNWGDEVFYIEMYEVKNLRHIYCEISIISSDGKINHDCWAKEISEVKFVDKKCQLAETFVGKSNLIRDQRHLLTNGGLVLQCYFQLSFGTAFNQIENYGVEPCESNVAVDTKETAMASTSQSSFSKNVLELLWNEGTFSDVTLRAGTKSFPVHKSILSVKSNKFQSIFLKEESENTSKVIDLPDVDENTLRSLLLYIYRGVVEDLNFGNALELYQSADKYELTDLKDICRNFLIANVSRSNIFQVLLIADIYQDKKIKKTAQEFISGLGNEFPFSDEWQDFKKRNSELAIETMEYILSRKRIKIEN